VYYHYELIATHVREYRKYQYTTLTGHLASAHQYLSDWTPEKFIDQASAIDPEIGAYISLVMEHKAHPEQAYKSCAGILSLGRKVGPERLRNACRRAHSYGVYNYPIIQQILERNMDQIDGSEQAEGLPMPTHPNIRGSNYYE
jgi:hypothetical protein